MQQVSNDDSGQDGAPATLYNDHAQYLPLSFLYTYLRRTESKNGQNTFAYMQYCKSEIMNEFKLISGEDAYCPQLNTAPHPSFS